MKFENLERGDLDYLFSITYEELRRLASAMSRNQSVTLNPTALVNEAWIKLARSPQISATSRVHFKRIAARAMRQVLVDAARRRSADKRASGDLVAFDESLGVASGEVDLLGLDSALDELAQIAPRQAMIVESRFFGGLEINEIAELTGISAATIVRDWRTARAWLARKVRR